jgi:hypothetical protein
VSAALALLAEATAAGMRVRLADGGGLRASGRAPPDLLARLRAHKAELVGLLSGGVCRHCGEVMGWPAPVGRMFADGMAAHHACHERAEAGHRCRLVDNAVPPAAPRRPLR